MSHEQHRHENPVKGFVNAVNEDIHELADMAKGNADKAQEKVNKRLDETQQRIDESREEMRKEDERNLGEARVTRHDDRRDDRENPLDAAGRAIERGAEKVSHAIGEATGSAERTAQDAKENLRETGDRVKDAYHEGVDKAQPRDNRGSTHQHGNFDKEAERHIPPVDFTKSTEEMVRGDVNAGA